MSMRRLAAILAADVAGFSGMMERDEIGTLTKIADLRRNIIEPVLQEHNGRLVKTVGDGFLVEFPSAVEAVRSAVQIVEGVADSIRLRVGINLGDIIVDKDGDVFGDSVNVAARLEQMADPGYIFVSGKVYDEIDGKLDCVLQDRGTRKVKNITRPVRVFAIRPGIQETNQRVSSKLLSQDIAYCRSSDGVRLAWATLGNGPPLVKSANYMNHLEYDWESPVWHHLLEGLAHDHMLIRYDARGNGMSDWECDEVSVEAFVRDLEAVVDAAGVDRFPLLGFSQGCAVAISYAVRHPEKVTHLVLYGGYALGGRKRSPQERAKRDAMSALMRVAWGADDPSFRQLFSSQFFPDGTKEQFDAFNEQQRRTTSPECAARYFDVVGDLDVMELLPQVTTPTLVMHVRGDRIAPIEAGREMAAKIPGARFVALQGHNHLFLENEPAAERYFEELRLFLGEA